MTTQQSTQITINTKIKSVLMCSFVYIDNSLSVKFYLSTDLFLFSN